jgi:hypothetical protein
VCGIASGKSCFDCEQQFCVNHIYACADCSNQYCGACLDAHHADGHWADSDTAFELAASHRTGRSSSTFELAAARGVVRASSVNSLDLLRSELAASQRPVRSSSGHRTDSDTAAARSVVRAPSVNSPDLLRSELAASHHVVRSSSVDLRPSTLAASNQHRQTSWSAIPIKLKSFFSQRLTRLATLIGFMFQSVALQSEAGL